jgi:CheY-like chemotaxis protein
LGLAISRQLVAVMGGEIGVSSVPGEGCTFSFTVRLGLLPASGVNPVPAPPAMDDSATAASYRHRFDGARVLLVDDVALNREVAVEILRSLGADAFEVSNGEQALAQLAAEPWDLVLMDLHMPVLDGVSAMSRLAEHAPERRPPVVALTASVMDEDRARCSEAGMVDFIAKPVDAENISRVLARWVPRFSGADQIAHSAARSQKSNARVSSALNKAQHGRMASIVAALRPYLQAQELVPDELVDLIRQAATEDVGNPHWQRLLDLIFDFDHAGALSALETTSTEEYDHEPSP